MPCRITCWKNPHRHRCICTLKNIQNKPTPLNLILAYRKMLFSVSVKCSFLLECCILFRCWGETRASPTVDIPRWPVLMLDDGAHYQMWFEGRPRLRLLLKMDLFFNHLFFCWGVWECRLSSSVEGQEGNCEAITMSFSSAGLLGGATGVCLYLPSAGYPGCADFFSPKVFASTTHINLIILLR